MTIEVDFIDFIISTADIAMNLSRINTVTDWPEPESIKNIQVFLRFINFY